MSANLVVLIVPTGARRWHVSTFPPLVPAAGTSRPSRRWCPPLENSFHFHI
jgi:hypothetical protein